jgi:hypothetical protein
VFRMYFLSETAQVELEKWTSVSPCLERPPRHRRQCFCLLLLPQGKARLRVIRSRFDVVVHCQVVEICLALRFI